MRNPVITKDTGSYILVLCCATSGSVRFGRRGILELKPGFYSYVGSAFGPGGLNARLARHFLPEKKLRWHIDYLRQHSEVESAWVCTEEQNLEHAWASVFSSLKDVDPIQGFGCSDCKCHSHLFASIKAPLVHTVARRSGCSIRRWTPPLSK